MIDQGVGVNGSILWVLGRAVANSSHKENSNPEEECCSSVLGVQGLAYWTKSQSVR